MAPQALIDQLSARAAELRAVTAFLTRIPVGAPDAAAAAAAPAIWAFPAVGWGLGAVARAGVARGLAFCFGRPPAGGERTTARGGHGPGRHSYGPGAGTRSPALGIS